MSVQNLGVKCAGINTFINIGQALLKVTVLELLLKVKLGMSPTLQHPYLYNYINKQAKSIERSRSLANQ
jgi:hypothetical protein